MEPIPRPARANSETRAVVPGFPAVAPNALGCRAAARHRPLDGRRARSAAAARSGLPRLDRRLAQRVGRGRILVAPERVSTEPSTRPKVLRCCYANRASCRQQTWVAAWLTMLRQAPHSRSHRGAGAASRPAGRPNPMKGKHDEKAHQHHRPGRSRGHGVRSTSVSGGSNARQGRLRTPGSPALPPGVDISQWPTYLKGSTTSYRYDMIVRETPGIKDLCQPNFSCPRHALPGHHDHR